MKLTPAAMALVRRASAGEVSLFRDTDAQPSPDPDKSKTEPKPPVDAARRGIIKGPCDRTRCHFMHPDLLHQDP